MASTKDEWAEFRKAPVSKDDWSEFTREASPSEVARTEPPPDPSEGMSALEKLATGAGYATDRVYRGIRGLFPPGLLPKDLMGGQGEEAAAEYQKHHPGGWATAGEIAGDVALSAIPISKASMLPKALGITSKLAPAVADIGANAGYAALTAPEDRGTAAMFGAGGAAAGRAVPWLAGRAFRPTTAGPEAQKLIDAGIQPTFGQVLSERGGFLPKAIARAEESATAIPFAGAPIRARRGQALEQFRTSSRTAALPPGATVAPQTIDELGVLLSNSYNKALKDVDFVGQNPFSTWNAADSVRLSSIGSGVTQPVKERAQAVVESIVEALDPAQMHTPSGAQFLERRLKDTAFKYKSSADADSRAYGDLIADVANDWRGKWRSALPDAASAELKQIDQAYSKFVPIRRAAATGNLIDPEAYTPKVLLRAIRAGDKSPNKSGYLRGDRPQQDLATAASKVLGSGINEPSLSSRLLVGGGLGLGGAHVGVVPTALAGTALAIYGTTQVQRYLTSNTALQKWLTANLAKMEPAMQEQVMRQVYNAASQAGRASTEAGR